MGSFTDYTENKVLELLVGKTAFATPAAYIGLSTTSVSDAGGNVTEPSSLGGYARAVTSAGAWTAASGGYITNAVTVGFPTANSAWGTVIDFTVCNSAALGNATLYGSLSAQKAVGIGDTPAVPPGGLVITLD